MKTCYTLFAIFLLSGCTPEPQAINFGSDGCHYCKMTIVDQRYGAELVTKKGKVYKYDAVECLINSVFADNLVTEENIHSLWTIDFSQPKTLIKADQVSYLHSKNLPSPMGMFLTAFGDKNKLEEAKRDYEGDIWSWDETKAFVIDGENVPGK